MPTSPDLPERFYRWLSLEQGLSDNSLQAYNHDLRLWLRFLERQNMDVLQADVPELQQFLAELHDLGISARTQARFISGLRAFYRFLRQEKLCERDPSTEVDMPELSKPLPHYLEIHEVDALLKIGRSLDPPHERFDGFELAKIERVRARRAVVPMLDQRAADAGEAGPPGLLPRFEAGADLVHAIQRDDALGVGARIEDFVARRAARLGQRERRVWARLYPMPAGAQVGGIDDEGCHSTDAEDLTTDGHR